jgi:hypothetical protein
MNAKLFYDFIDIEIVDFGNIMKKIVNEPHFELTWRHFQRFTNVHESDASARAG